MRPALVLAVAVLAMACSRTRTVKIGWDVPAVAPEGYRIFIDDRMVLDIPPPPVDRRCDCMTVPLAVPRGKHVVEVLAYRNGTGAATSITVQ
jgi:hypothetical protein